MDIITLRNLSNEELNKELQELMKQSFKLRIQKKTGQDVKSHNFSLLRKNVAQIKTLLSERKTVEKPL